jgi:hypothetical protein
MFAHDSLKDMNLLDINLPNYFLADLPGEEHLTPAIITAACETLKHNREKFLAPRQTGEIVEILCAVAAEWRQPDNRFRQLALKSAWSAGAPRELAEETAGFSRPVLEKGLDGFFRQFTPENFQALLAQDLGDGTAVPGAAADEPGAGAAHAVGAVHEMRERRVAPAPAVCPFDLRGGPQTGRVPGTGGMARRQSPT